MFLFFFLSLILASSLAKVMKSTKFAGFNRDGFLATGMARYLSQLADRRRMRVLQLDPLGGKVGAEGCCMDALCLPRLRLS